MNRKEFILSVIKEIHYIFDRKGIEKELNDHIDDSIEELISEGYTYEEAELKAIEQMGNPQYIGKELNREHNPFIGYIYILSRYMLIFVLIISIIGGLSLLYSVFKVYTPSVYHQAKESYKTDIKIETNINDIYIDYISKNKDDTYSLSVRYIRDIFYSRSSIIRYIDIYDTNSHNLNIGSSGDTSILGESRYMVFEKPENDIIVIKVYNGESIEMDIGDYFYEEESKEYTD